MIANFSDHASNERTFLAWVRTAIAITGFGLAAAHLSDQPVNGRTEILLLASGGLVIVCAYVRMRHFRRLIASSDDLDQTEMPKDTLLLALIVSLALLLGTFMLHVT